MNILFCGDKNIQNGLLIAVISLLEHTKEDLDVYVLTLNMSVNDKHYEPIDGRLSDYCNTELSKKYDNRLRIKLIDQLQVQRPEDLRPSLAHLSYR